jgi:hypothetical protein
MIETTRAAPAPTMHAASIFDKPRVLWLQHREAALNWLAFGLLLAAWNAADSNDPCGGKPRPDALRAYPSVTVRAVMRTSG